MEIIVEEFVGGGHGNYGFQARRISHAICMELNPPQEMPNMPILPFDQG